DFRLHREHPPGDALRGSQGAHRGTERLLRVAAGVEDVGEDGGIERGEVIEERGHGWMGNEGDSRRECGKGKGVKRGWSGFLPPSVPLGGRRPDPDEASRMGK